MFGIGTTELIIILVIILIIFGVGKLPSIGSGLGEAIRNFKKSSSEEEIDVTPQKEKLESAAGTKPTSATKPEEPAKKM
ncbi:MAG: twin-arginine translocase TatA/TatE family subunit [Deltaproteobacteria bacterium]|nr:twin-arginine translocase TatA/TatE family subunit [Deltaproteobacteria bacterium]